MRMLQDATALSIAIFRMRSLRFKRLLLADVASVQPKVDAGMELFEIGQRL